MSESTTLPLRRLLQALSLIGTLLLSGCGDTSQSPEDPRILGVPPQVAYLGVDYSYNFGATGGDNLLNYSLVNNPSWLALDATTNKARKGIVLRGVPGVTGGGSGEDDLGEYDRIRITTNDGNLLGDTAFSIEVRRNALEVAETTLTEGQANEPNMEKDSEEICEIPDMDVTREITVDHDNLILGDGENYGPASRDYTTRRSLIRVNLAQPSVKPVTVRFRVSDDQDPDICEDSDTPCEYQGSNRDRAIFGEDLLLNGNASNYQGGGFPEPPEYIEYISEGETGATGLLNFEAGQTTCFIPVWVHGDDLAEETEYFNVELEQVTEGIASLSGEGAVASQRVNIEDETPTVSLEHDTLVLSDGIGQTVTATLSHPNDTGETLYASLEAVDEEGESADNDFAELPREIAFARGEDEVSFDLTAEAGNNEPLEEEVVRELRFDRDFQFGRDGAAGTTETSSDTYINEWTTDVAASLDLNRPFDIESLVTGALGGVYVAGVDDSGEVGLQSINRLSDASPLADDQDVVALGEVNNSGIDWPAPTRGTIELAFVGESSGTDNAPDITRHLGLAYAVDTDPATGFASLFRSRISTQDDGSGGTETVRSDSSEELLWRIDSLGSNWNQQALAVDTGESLYAAGLGDGGDPIRMTRIDTEEDEDTGNTSANPVWTENLAAGNESTIAGLFTGSNSGTLLVGDTWGQVDSDTLVGGRDFFLLGRDNDGSINEQSQFGIEEDDRVKLADSSGDRLWLAGESAYLYETNDSGGIEQAGDAEAAPFVLTADRTGSVQGVLHPNELEDESGIETIQALTVSGNTLIFGGQGSDGNAYLMAVRYSSTEDEDENPIRKRWRVDIDAEGVIDMDYFQGRKVFVVLDAGDDQVIRLYDLHGNCLTDGCPAEGG